MALFIINNSLSATALYAFHGNRQNELPASYEAGIQLSSSIDIDFYFSTSNLTSSTAAYPSDHKWPPKRRNFNCGNSKNNTLTELHLNTQTIAEIPILGRANTNTYT